MQTWIVEVEGDKYRVISGYLDGKKVTNEWTLAIAKNVGRSNESTPEMQAQIEAQALWDKKRSAEYRESLAEIDSIPGVEVMLAKSFSDYADKIEYPVFCQPKLDGMRCTVGLMQGMLSRNNKPIVSAPHIYEALLPVLQANPSVIFDGELYAHHLKSDFNRVMHLARQSDPTAADLAESKAELQYWIYDAISPVALTFSKRTSGIDEAVGLLWNHFTSISPIVRVLTHVAQSRDVLDSYYSEYLVDGYEGQIVRINAPYEHKRSANLLKRKEFMDGEFAILDVIEGIGNRSGMAGAMRFEIAGKPFNAGIRGNETYFTQLLSQRSQLIGKMATVRYFALTPDGIPRFPVVTDIGRVDA